MKHFIHLIFFIFFITNLFAQHTIEGYVFDAETGNPLPEANVRIEESGKGTSTDKNGYYVMSQIRPGSYTISVTYIGYKPISKQIEIEQNMTGEDFFLTKTEERMKSIVVTATRTKRNIEDIPASINVIESETIQHTPASNFDNLLQGIPNVYVSRSWGIFSKNASLNMRGMDDVNRVLVLLDGVPLNKTGGGSINWHLIMPEKVERVEVLKGPNSALYGNHAMGGVINIITKTPEEPFSGSVSASSASYNTFGGKFLLGGNHQKTGRGFYWNANGFYRKGDGYVIDPVEERDSTSSKAFLEEWSLGAKAGYTFNENHQIEIEYNYYDDQRGAGTTVYETNGSYDKYTTNYLKANYSGYFGKTRLEANAFFQYEDYVKQKEGLNRAGDKYKFVNTFTDSKDGGLWVSLTRAFGRHLITAGIDSKRGHATAEDMYYTATDLVTYNGTIDFVAGFVQDEFDVFNENLKIIAGFRFDYATLHDAGLTIEMPTSESDYIKPYEGEYEATSWTSLSPKVSMQYAFTNDFKTYISASGGFKPAKLKDLASSGKISKGFKLANPHLKPERISNYEIGFDWQIHSRVSLRGASYYSLGKDFQYFVGTGDSTYTGGTSLKPVLRRENISEVEITGIELSASFSILKGLTFNTNYTYNSSKIKEFDNQEYEKDLSGKYLIEIPAHQAFAGLYWNNRIVNTAIIYHYIGTMWADDENTQQLDDYSLVDIRISRTFKQHIFAGLNVQDIFDVVYIDKKGRLSPGRFITFELGYRF